MEELLNDIYILNDKYNCENNIIIRQDMYKHENDIKLWGRIITANSLGKNSNMAFSMYRNISLINSKGIDIGDVLSLMNIKEVSVYGYGEMGAILINEVKDKIKINHVYDKNKKNEKIENEFISIKIEGIENIALDTSELIIITPALSYQEISWKLINKGVNRNKIIAFNTILSIAKKSINDLKQFKCKKQFLITGAQFKNKGAQSMLFVTINEIRKRFKDSIIWYLPVDESSTYSEKLMDMYNFYFLLDGHNLNSQLFQIVTGLSAIIDISGYALSSYWNNEWYINNLRISYNYKIPMYLMPQSFGPFEFNKDKNKELSYLLKYMEKIYTREETSYKYLTKKYKLQNIFKSKDLVLQNDSVDIKNIYTKPKNKIQIDLGNKINIAIIPNIRLSEFSSSDYVLNMFEIIIENILSTGVWVYIIAHSDDYDLCKKIKNKKYKNNNKVVLMDKELDCLEFVDVLKNFKYIIAARYHSIVHAYKQGIPVFIIGWEEKYYELAKLFEQLQYLIDIRNEINKEIILKKLNLFIENIDAESKFIKEKKQYIYNNNCFDFLDDLND